MTFSKLTELAEYYETVKMHESAVREREKALGVIYIMKSGTLDCYVDFFNAKINRNI